MIRIFTKASIVILIIVISFATATRCNINERPLKMMRDIYKLILFYLVLIIIIYNVTVTIDEACEDSNSAIYPCPNFLTTLENVPIKSPSLM